jgi:hypothetical protein
MNKNYDLELAVMCWITNVTGYEWTLDEIADVCGITRQAVRNEEGKARRRMWRLLHRDRQLIKELNESRGLDGANRYFLPRWDGKRYYVSTKEGGETAGR